MIKIISFDLDGTLVQNTFADSVWLKGFPTLYAKEKNITIDEAKEFLFKEYDKVGMARKEWYDIDWWFKRFQIKKDWHDLLSDFRTNIHIFPESKNVINKLSKKFKLIIVSNAKREFVDIQLKQTSLKPYFHSIFSSLSDFDSVKKFPDVYRKICDILNVQVNEIIHIGDNKEFDFLSPKRIGIKSFYLNRDRTETGEGIVHSLSDFEKIIG
jgi:putative hydrolase of the HAD superfamily